jgi:hypothetical protein
MLPSCQTTPLPFLNLLRLPAMNSVHCLIAWKRFILSVAALAALAPSAALANVVNVECFSNGDGTTSCQRLRDGEWFDCARSIGGVSTCVSRDVVPGRDDPITCTMDGGGIFTCTSASRGTSGSNMPPTSVFGF